MYEYIYLVNSWLGKNLKYITFMKKRITSNTTGGDKKQRTLDREWQRCIDEREEKEIFILRTVHTAIEADRKEENKISQRNHWQTFT